MLEAHKTLVQCDFDGTITEQDVSLMLLDAFASPDWRQLLEEYMEGNMSVGAFNSKAFATVRANKQTMLETVRDRVKVRAGFHEFVAYCHKRNFRLVIVSNGLDFYIEAILRTAGMEDIEVIASRTEFHPEGLKAQYVGPDGDLLEDGFKQAHVNLFLARGYQVVYVGDGMSDFIPACQCHHIFAVGGLLYRCKQNNIPSTSFVDFHDIVRKLKLL